MKRSLVFFMSAVILFPGFAAAQKDNRTTYDEPAAGMMAGPGMMGGRNMCSGAIDAKITVSESGNVFVLIGTTLFKFDKDLNFVRKVEIPFDAEDVKRMSRETCPAAGLPGQTQEKAAQPAQ